MFRKGQAKHWLALCVCPCNKNYGRYRQCRMETHCQDSGTCKIRVITQQVLSDFYPQGRMEHGLEVRECVLRDSEYVWGCRSGNSPIHMPMHKLFLLSGMRAVFSQDSAYTIDLEAYWVLEAVNPIPGANWNLIWSAAAAARWLRMPF